MIDVRDKDDMGKLRYKYGETVYKCVPSPFLGTLGVGESLQAIENNMYRAPLYEHKVPATDFLVIRTRNHYFIRQVDAVYTAGQECPLYKVPAPKSKKVIDFNRDFLKVESSISLLYKIYIQCNTALL